MLVFAAAALAALVAGFSAANAAAAGLRFTALPRAPFEGEKPTFGVGGAPNGAICTLTLIYSGGRTDRFGAQAIADRATWTVRIPAVPPGRASVAAACGSAGSVHASILIRWAVQAPSITILKRGFTQKLDRYGSGSSLGWGAAVRNDRARSDASSVQLLVNYVDAGNRVLGTGFTTISRLPTASIVYVGGQTHLSTQTPVARLEIVVQARSAPPQAGTPPLVSDVAMLPGSDGYLASLTGQILNNYPRSMHSAALGAVVLDANGNILGGGTTYASGPVSYGAREFFSMANTFSTIPVSEASSAVISAVPNFPTVS